VLIFLFFELVIDNLKYRYDNEIGRLLAITFVNVRQTLLGKAFLEPALFRKRFDRSSKVAPMATTASLGNVE
jgi:hypothetical protein